jgi:integrase
MKGSAKRRGKDTFRLRFNLPPDAVTGARRQHTETVRARTQRHADELLAAAMRKAGVDPEPGGTSAHTVAELIERWFPIHRRKLAPQTALRWREWIDRYIIPNIGAVRLDKLTTFDVDELYGALLATGGKNGGSLGSWTVRKVHTILRLAFSQGVVWRWLDTNPCLAATQPKAPAAVPSPTSPEETQRILAEAARVDDTGEWHAFLRVQASWGTRPEEACALRWDVVDLETGNASIFRTVVKGPKGWVVEDEPKEEASKRTIAMGDETTAVLKAWKRRQAEEALKRGVRLERSAFVFARDQLGRKPWTPETASQRFDRLVKRLEIDHVLYDLRHFHITQLLGAGVDPVTVAGRVGHANPMMTMKVYAAWIPARDQAAAEIGGRILDELTGG